MIYSRTGLRRSPQAARRRYTTKCWSCMDNGFQKCWTLSRVSVLVRKNWHTVTMAPVRTYGIHPCTCMHRYGKYLCVGIHGGGRMTSTMHLIQSTMRSPPEILPPFTPGSSKQRAHMQDFQRGFSPRASRSYQQTQTSEYAPHGRLPSFDH